MLGLQEAIDWDYDKERASNLTRTLEGYTKKKAELAAKREAQEPTP